VNAPAASGPGASERGARPRWLAAAPFLGRAPDLTRRQWRVLGLVSIASLFDQYDVALFALALKQIQQGLGLAEAQLGAIGSLVRMGAIGAFPLLLAADRIGRRRLLLITIVAYTLFTGATAFASSPTLFVACQLLARLFITAEALLAFVVIAEELDAADRGWGVGAVNALAIVGQGLALALFAFVDVLPLGWRSLYGLGLLPLAVVAYLRRNLPETQRFEELLAARAAAPRAGPLAPLLALARENRGRAAAIGALFFFEAFSSHAVGFFSVKYIQEAHGWLPWQISVLALGGGLVLLFANAATGRLSDVLGRRRVAVVALAVYPALALWFFSATGAAVGVSWIAMSFFGIACDVMLYTFAAELFPTSQRSTAAGVWIVIRTLGGALGLWCEGRLYAASGSHAVAISILALAGFICPLVVAGCLPETSRRPLEEIAPER